MKLSTRKLVAVSVAVAAASASSAAMSEVFLTCKGEEHRKHHDERSPVSFNATLDSDKKTIVFRTAQTIKNYDTNTKKTTDRTDVEESSYAITSADDFLALQNHQSEKRDGRIVLKRGSFKKLEVVAIHEDDVAHGYLNTLSGELRIETKYYATQGSGYEYGWQITASCAKAQKLF